MFYIKQNENDVNDINIDSLKLINIPQGYDFN